MTANEDFLRRINETFEKIDTETLGIKVTEHPMGMIELYTDGNNPIMIYPKPDHRPAEFTVLNFSVDNIEKTVDKMMAKGVIFEKYTENIRTDGQGISRSERVNIAWFRNPAGNILSILEEN